MYNGNDFLFSYFSDYPYSWYEDITSSSRFYALAAVFGGVIIGLIVAEIKPYAKLNKEDQGILCSSLGKDSLVGYILSLGVRRAYRRNGIASLLLEQLLAHVTAPERSTVKAVFLHVLSSNAPAILFYQRRHFRLHSFLPYYYVINGQCQDGFTYVLYINSGHLPWGLWDWMRHVAGAMASLGPCRVPQWIWQRLLWAATLVSYHRWYFLQCRTHVRIGNFTEWRRVWHYYEPTPMLMSKAMNRNKNERAKINSRKKFE